MKRPVAGKYFNKKYEDKKMKKQNFELKNEKIRLEFEKIKKNSPQKLSQRLNLSWSNWGFGLEALEVSAKRISDAGIEFIELHGNHYGRKTQRRHYPSIYIAKPQAHLNTSRLPRGCPCRTCARSTFIAAKKAHTFFETVHGPTVVQEGL